MSDAPVAVETPAAPVAMPDAMSARDAAKILADSRWKRNQPEETESPAEAPQEAPQSEISTEAEPALEGADAPPQEAPVETPELPTIEPPRSWTAEHKERFASLPRDVQEYVAQREQDRERELRRGQNEHAERLKGLTAKEQAAEQARSQYEQALPALMQALQQQQQGEFSDIKTIADVERLAREDWPRYALWDAQQKKIAAVTQEMKAATERQAQEVSQKWAAYATREDQAFVEKVPEMSDPAKAKALADAAANVLRDSGFTDDELGKLWNGQAGLSLRDHRVQLLIRDAVRLQQAQKAAKVAPKPLPPVQKPGVRGDRADMATLELKALEKKAYESANPRDMARLLAARRAAQR